MSLVAILKTRFLYNSDKVDIICRNGIFQPGSIDDARGGTTFFLSFGVVSFRPCQYGFQYIFYVALLLAWSKRVE